MQLPKRPKILISRGDVLGDVVVTTALLAPLKQAFPEAELYYLVREDFHEVLEGHPLVSGCLSDPLPYTVTRKEWPLVWGLAQTIRSYDFDVFLGLWEAPQYALLAKLSGIKVRIGHGMGMVHHLCYSHTVALDRLDYTLHKIDYNARLLVPLGIRLGADFPVSLAVKQDVEAQLLAVYPWVKDQNFVVVHLDAGNPQRIMFDHQFLAIVQYLLTTPVSHIVLIGRQRNLKTAEYLLHSCGHDSRLCNVVDAVTLGQLSVFIKHCLFLMGSDSGPVHLAAGFQRPVVVYYVNRIQNAFHWGPWKTPHVIVRSLHQCVDVCRPTECQKPDCREVFPMEEFYQAITQLVDGDCSHPKDPKRYWMRVTCTFGVLTNQSEGLLVQDLRGHGLRFLVHSPVFSIRHMVQWVTQNNVNWILVDTSSLWVRLKLEIVRRIAANYMTFFPRIQYLNRCVTEDVLVL